MKDNAVSLSFGFLAKDTFKRADGIQELREIDLFEISITPAPANSDTRILSTKSTDPTEPGSEAQLFTPEQERIKSPHYDQMYNLLTESLPSDPDSVIERERNARSASFDAGVTEQRSRSPSATT
jgi:hypothetical protein